jgi:hypothetical protein
MVFGVMVSGLGLWITSLHMVEPMLLFAMFPWMYLQWLIPWTMLDYVISPLGYGAILIVLGILVASQRRTALIVALVLVSVETVPSAFVAVMSPGFVAAVLPRLALVVYMVTTLRAVGRVQSIDTAEPSDATRPADVPPPAAVRTRRVVLAWVVAVAAGPAWGMAVRAGDAFVDTGMRYTDDQVGQLVGWWLPRDWPAGVVAFGVGWFAESRKTAMARAAVALVVATLVPMTNMHYGDLPSELIGAAIFGLVMGWLGREGRGYSALSLLAALSAPALMAVDILRQPGGLHWDLTGSLVVLVAAGVMAVAILVRVTVWGPVRRRQNRPVTTASLP